MTFASRAVLGTVVASIGLSWALPASADVQACLSASEKGQKLRNAGKLREARENFVICGAASCPTLIRDDCSRWNSELATALPTVVFGARDKSGNDLFDVTVTMDGEALVRTLDGKPVTVDPGRHAFKFESADLPQVTQTILIKEGEKSRVINVTFDGAGPAAPPQVPPAPPVSGVMLQPATPAPSPEPKRGYIALTGSVDGASYRFGPAFGDPNVRYDFYGSSLGARFGYFAAKMIALDAVFEVGQMRATYNVAPGTGESETTLTHWMLMPAFRFATTGRVRFTVGSGIGVHVMDLERKLGGASTTTASGIGAAFLLDSGAQFDLGPVFIETVAFVNVHTNGTVREAISDDRAVLASLGARVGLRLGVGIRF